jgi:hypothetical protein
MWFWFLVRVMGWKDPFALCPRTPEGDQQFLDLLRRRTLIEARHFKVAEREAVARPAVYEEAMALILRRFTEIGRTYWYYSIWWSRYSLENCSW